MMKRVHFSYIQWTGFLLMLGVFVISSVFDYPALLFLYPIVLLWCSYHARNQKKIIALGIIATTFILAAQAWSLINSPDGSQSNITGSFLSLVLTWYIVTVACGVVRMLEGLRRENLEATQVFEHSTEGVLFIDQDGNIRLANPHAKGLLGFGAGVIEGAPVLGFISRNDQRTVFERMFRTLLERSGEFALKEVAIRSNFGNTILVEGKLNSYPKNGSHEVLMFFKDVTSLRNQDELLRMHIKTAKLQTERLEDIVEQRTCELRAINAELRRSQYFYKVMAEHFPDGIIGVLDQDMNFIVVDGGNFHTYTEDADVNEHDFRRDPRSFLDIAGNSLRDVFQGKKLAMDLHYQGRDYSLSSVPIENEDGDIHEILIVIRDISRRKSLERDLVRTLEKERELNLLKTRFVTMASHEFRTPLSTILSSAFLMENYTGEQLESEKHKHVSRIKRAVRGLTETLNDFLSLGKLEEGMINIQKSSVNPRDYITELVQEISVVKKESQSVNLTFEGRSRMMVTDWQMVRNILFNLLSNAIKYTPAGGVIDVRCAADEKRLVIEVADNGMGIPRDEQKFLFSRFFRAKNATGIEGTGLGLNIVEKYVTLLGGTVDFHSVENRGTTFTVFIPLSETLSECANTIAHDQNLKEEPYELQHLANRG